MQVTHAGLVEIEQSEGFSSRPYLDRIARPPRPTTGFGETDGVHMGDGPITRAQAEQRLIKRFDKDYAWALEPFVKLDGFNQNMYDALASFIWNCGVGSVGSNTRVGRNLRLRRWNDAADAMLAWNKAGGVVIEGLRLRRIREHTLFLKPVGHIDSYFLTKWERDTVDALLAERRTAKRHGGWEHVDQTHLLNASAAKKALRERIKVLENAGIDKAHRRQRRSAILAAIG